MFYISQNTSLTGCIIFLIVWLILFILRKDLRIKMLVMSLATAPMGPISEIFYLRDYWHPQLFNGWPIGLEDLLFGFAIGGIATIIYEIVFGKRYLKRHLQSHIKWMLTASLFGVTWMIIGTFILNINSIYVSTMGFIAIGLAVTMSRHDLLKDAFFSGLLVGLLMLLFYALFNYLFPGIIAQWWQLRNISGVMILGAPLEELMWGFGWGFIAGPIYEFVNGLRFRK